MLTIPIRTRQLVQAAVSTNILPQVSSTPASQRRTLFGGLFGRSKKDDSFAPAVPKNPLTEEYLRRKPKAVEAGIKKGELSSSSIFEDEAVAGAKPKSEATSASNARNQPMARNPRTMAAKLDPDPVSRRRWQRKMVMREVQKRGRLTKTQALRQQERESTLRSHNFKTSVKKLGALARQISGKTIEEAITQMRFSPKKASADVLHHLVHARNEAIVSRGMGLGADEEPRKIMTNDGKRITVKNPTTVYVSQAWVGKGTYTKVPDFRARGQTNIMKSPTTHLALVLKEEKTRLRLHDEKVQKVARRKVWTQLPNRPINHQRQHYSW